MNPSRFAGVPFRDRATLEIEVDEELARRIPGTSSPLIFTQEHFPALVRQIRKEWEREYGPLASRPTRPSRQPRQRP